MTRFIPKINREHKVLVLLKFVKKIRSSQDNIICISFCCLPLLSGKSMILFSFSQRTLKQKIFAKTTTHTKFVWDWVVHVYYKCIDNIYITLASLIWQAVFKNWSVLKLTLKSIVVACQISCLNCTSLFWISVHCASLCFLP